jgi:hypothetical protein
MKKEKDKKQDRPKKRHRPFLFSFLSTLLRKTFFILAAFFIVV